jgi:hypothetical protein
MTGGQAATLLLQHLKQEPMPIIEERARVRVDSDIKPATVVKMPKRK